MLLKCHQPHDPPRNRRETKQKVQSQLTTAIDLANDNSSMPLNTKDEAHFLIVSIVILLLTFVVGMSAVAYVGCWFLRKKWNQVIKKATTLSRLVTHPTSSKKSVVQKIYFPDAMEEDSDGFYEEMFALS